MNRQVEIINGPYSLITSFDTNKNITAHFKYEEACNPKCQEATKLIIHADKFYTFVEMLEAERVYAGIPFNINSWYRSPTFNKECGGVADSRHLIACAADVALGNLTDAKFKFYEDSWRAITQGRKIPAEIFRYSWGVHFGAFVEYTKSFYVKDMRK